MTGHQLPVEAISRIVAVLSQEPHVQRVVLYGSRAKGCAKPGSDIDLAIEAPGAERTILLRLDQELDDLLLPWMIDLNFLHLIHNQDLRDHIDRVGVTWFVRNAAHRESHRIPTLTDSTPHLL